MQKKLSILMLLVLLVSSFTTSFANDVEIVSTSNYDVKVNGMSEIPNAGHLVPKAGYTFVKVDVEVHSNTPETISIEGTSLAKLTVDGIDYLPLDHYSLYNLSTRLHHQQMVFGSLYFEIPQNAQVKKLHIIAQEEKSESTSDEKKDLGPLEQATNTYFLLVGAKEDFNFKIIDQSTNKASMEKRKKELEDDYLLLSISEYKVPPTLTKIVEKTTSENAEKKPIAPANRSEMINVSINNNHFTDRHPLGFGDQNQKYLVIDITVENNSNEDIGITPNMWFKLLKNEYANISLFLPSDHNLSKVLSPGSITSGSLVFPIDDQNANYQLVVKPLIQEKPSQVIDIKK